ncbi:MAG: hypothetical protein K0U84_18930 [Actinomycetia bacterium]|nr:hypothetical protein [Actinomycetes bacterium]
MSSTTARCRIVYDDEFRPDLAEGLRGDRSTDAMQRGFEELADTLGKSVDRPDEVSLVVAVNLARAVKRRQPGTAYHTDRGTGTVAARTMPCGDGRIEVIIETGFLTAFDKHGKVRLTTAGHPQLSQLGLAQMKITIIHEAQHATMLQRNSGYDQFKVGEHDSDHPQWDYAVAAKILDEYRAEWNATQHDSRKPPSVDHVVEVLEHLGCGLAAADARYQAAPGPGAVRKLMEDVYNACIPYWTWMAYWAAQCRGNQIQIGAEIQSLNLWKRYVGSTWGGMLEILDGGPIEDLGTSEAKLRQAAVSVAGQWIPQSLHQVGFRHLATPGGEEFYIDRHDFPSE